MKARWATNADRAELTEFWLKLFIRSDYSGNTLVHHESGFPLYSYAPELKYENGLCKMLLEGHVCIFQTRPMVSAHLSMWSKLYVTTAMDCDVRRSLLWP